MNLTPAQEKAVSLDSGKIVLAGAGSGKTTILAERYLRLLEEKKTAPQNIVAMTFTRKAAAQLKSRIYRQILKRENENSAEQEFWHSQRESFAWARIGTIHNICGRLLRAYPMQAGLIQHSQLLTAVVSINESLFISTCETCPTHEILTCRNCWILPVAWRQ